MSSKSHFMAVALWILATAAVAADKPPQAVANPSSRGPRGQACAGSCDPSRFLQYIEQTLEERS
jgi:hypothetical protein